jgi:RND family efflux transporter MFP subunit
VDNSLEGKGMTHFPVAEPDIHARNDTGADNLTLVRPRRGRRVLGAGIVVAALLAAGGGLAWQHGRETVAHAAPAAPLPVTVSLPLQETVAPTTGFLGQFSAVESVTLRAQVGGILTAISFQDGQIVHQGDLLFTIDPRPYQIALRQAVAQFQTAQAKHELAVAELWRARQLKQTDFGTAENVDERVADENSAQAAIETAKAAITNAQLDLEFSEIRAPFTGRIGTHLVSVGNLVSGSRGGTSATTPLATIVSLDPVYLDFDMSEADYLAYQRAHPDARQRPGDVAVSLNGDGRFDRKGSLDFIDNALDRGSGTIHARATVPNPDLAITPGQFARLRLVTGTPGPALLVPAAAIVPDQSQEMVMTVAADGTVVPKVVETGALYHGLRVIRSGLAPSDRVIIDGLVRARPGGKVTPVNGAIAPAAGDENS